MNDPGLTLNSAWIFDNAIDTINTMVFYILLINSKQTGKEYFHDQSVAQNGFGCWLCVNVIIIIIFVHIFISISYYQWLLLVIISLDNQPTNQPGLK